LGKLRCRITAPPRRERRSGILSATRETCLWRGDRRDERNITGTPFYRTSPKVRTTSQRPRSQGFPQNFNYVGGDFVSASSGISGTKNIAPIPRVRSVFARDSHGATFLLRHNFLETSLACLRPIKIFCRASGRNAARLYAGSNLPDPTKQSLLPVQNPAFVRECVAHGFPGAGHQRHV